MWSNTRRDSGAYRWGAWRRLPKGLRRHDRRFRPGWARCRQQTMAPDAGRKAAFTRHAGIGADDSILADAGALNLGAREGAAKAASAGRGGSGPAPPFRGGGGALTLPPQSLRSRLQHNPL